jgi:hypothetical protein
MKENHRRVLFTLVTYCLPGVTTTAQTVTSTNCDDGGNSKVRECDVARLREMGMTTMEELPSSYESRVPADESPMAVVNSAPRGIVPDMEWALDDIVPYIHEKDHYLRLSNACEMANKVIRIDSPVDIIRISPVSKAFHTKEWLHAYPAMSTRELCANDGDTDRAFTEEGAWTPTYRYVPVPKDLARECVGDGGIETLRPWFVRCSSQTQF